MNFKNLKYVALLTLITQPHLYSHAVLEQEATRSNTQQQMIAHFFNIVIQGLLLVNAEKKEDKVQAAANALNSISNITQLTVRTAPIENQELLDYVTAHHEDILAYIQNIINSEPHTEHEQID